MSIHSEIMDGSPEKKFVENLCSDRWARMSNPCKSCKFRYPIEDDEGRCCIFPTCPRDWAMFEK